MMRNLAPRISLIGWIFWLVLSVVLMIVLRFQTCCIADFPVGRPSFVRALADLEIRETAGLETCATEYVTEFAPRSTNGEGRREGEERVCITIDDQFLKASHAAAAERICRSLRW